jgi:hypothetical protein
MTTTNPNTAMSLMMNLCELHALSAIIKPCIFLQRHVAFCIASETGDSTVLFAAFSLRTVFLRTVFVPAVYEVNDQCSLRKSSRYMTPAC